MNRYIEPLVQVGSEMVALAKKLNEQKAQSLLSSEKRLIRLAVMQRLATMVGDIVSTTGTRNGESWASAIDRLQEELSTIRKDLED